MSKALEAFPATAGVANPHELQDACVNGAGFVMVAVGSGVNTLALLLCPIMLAVEA